MNPTKAIMQVANATLDYIEEATAEYEVYSAEKREAAWKAMNAALDEVPNDIEDYVMVPRALVEQAILEVTASDLCRDSTTPEELEKCLE